MQLKNTYLMAIFLVVLLVSATASCTQTHSVNLKWNQITAEEVLIDVILPSGIEVKGIRYRKENLAKKWLLQLKSTSGTTIQLGNKYSSSMSHQDFAELFAVLVSSIKEKNHGQLDIVQIGLGFISELWEDTSAFLREGAVQSNFKLSGKDLELAKKISYSLKNSLVLKTLCDELVRIQKSCVQNYVDMNPVTFEHEYIGKNWSHVVMLPSLGMPLNELWFGVNLRNSAEQQD